MSAEILQSVYEEAENTLSKDIPSQLAFNPDIDNPEKFRFENFPVDKYGALLEPDKYDRRSVIVDFTESLEQSVTKTHYAAPPFDRPISQFHRRYDTVASLGTFASGIVIQAVGMVTNNKEAWDAGVITSFVGSLSIVAIPVGRCVVEQAKYNLNPRNYSGQK